LIILKILMKLLILLTKPMKLFLRFYLGDIQRSLNEQWCTVTFEQVERYENIQKIFDSIRRKLISF